MRLCDSNLFECRIGWWLTGLLSFVDNDNDNDDNDHDNDLFNVDNVGGGRPILPARGSCIQRSTSI